MSGESQGFLAFAIESIADAKHCLYVSGSGGIGFQFGAQIADVDVHRPLDSFESIAAQTLQQIGAREHLSRRVMNMINRLNSEGVRSISRFMIVT